MILSPRRFSALLVDGAATGCSAYMLTVLSLDGTRLLSTRLYAWPLELTLSAALLVAFSLQALFAHRLAYLSAATAVRDTFLAIPVFHLLAILTADPLWFHLALFSWIIAFSAYELAVGRWVMLAPDATGRRVQTNLHLVGLACGVLLGRFFWTVIASNEIAAFTPLPLAMMAAWRWHHAARHVLSQSARPVVFHWRQLTSDPMLIALAAVSMCLGLFAGYLLFSGTALGPLVQGTALFLLTSRGIERLGASRAARLVLYLAAIAMGIDGVIWDASVISPYVLSYAAAAIFAAVRMGAFESHHVMSSLDRLCIHVGGVLIGFLTAGTLVWAHVEPVRVLISLGFVAATISYLASFLFDETTSPLGHVR